MTQIIFHARAVAASVAMGSAHHATERWTFVRHLAECFSVLSCHTYKSVLSDGTPVPVLGNFPRRMRSSVQTRAPVSYHTIPMFNATSQLSPTCPAYA